MKREISPVAIAAILVVALIAIGLYGYRAMQPAPYTPSPGVTADGGDAPGALATAGSQGQPLSPGEQAYEQSLKGGGSTPGVPGGN